MSLKDISFKDRGRCRLWVKMEHFFIGNYVFVICMQKKTPNMAIIFRQNCETEFFHIKNEPHGTLKRLKRKRNIRSRTDPGFPTPGARMTVVYTNSLKWSKII